MRWVTLLSTLFQKPLKASCGKRSACSRTLTSSTHLLIALWVFQPNCSHQFLCAHASPVGLHTCLSSALTTALFAQVLNTSVKMSAQFQQLISAKNLRV